jgi:hypothetical protein
LRPKIQLNRQYTTDKLQGNNSNVGKAWSETRPPTIHKSYMGHSLQGGVSQKNQVGPHEARLTAHYTLTAHSQGLGFSIRLPPAEPPAPPANPQRRRLQSSLLLLRYLSVHLSPRRRRCRQCWSLILYLQFGILSWQVSGKGEVRQDVHGEEEDPEGQGRRAL